MIGDIITGALCVTGAIFFIIGTTGLLRLPDLYTRIHVCSKCDTLGGCSVLLGMAVYSGISFAALKLVLIVLFLLLSSATCGHAIGRSAFVRGMPVWRREEDDASEGGQSS